MLKFFKFLPGNGISDKTAPVPTSNPLTSAIDIEIDAAARAYIQKSNTIGLSIGILKDGDINTYNYGETEKGNGILPGADSIFEIGSITKAFTAALLAHFVAEDKVSLMDPITKYLPEDVAVNPALQNITLLHLANHTSGLQRLPWNFYFYSGTLRNPYKNYTNSRFFYALRKCKLITAPGQVYAYSNQGFGLLGVILERISGKTFEQLVKEMITGPLNMESTAQHLSPALAERLVKGYNAKGRQTSHWDFDALAGCGALRSSVHDLLLFAGANMANGNGLLSRSLKLTHQVTFFKTPKVALGWHLLTLNGVDYHWHNGGTYGSRSFLLFNTEKRLAIVILSNAAVSCDKLAVGILKMLAD